MRSTLKQTLKAAGSILLSASMSIGMAAQSVLPVAAETSSRVEEIINGMSVRQKIEQMIMIDFRKWGPTYDEAQDFTVMNDEVAQIIENYDFGSVIYFANNIKETEQSFVLTQELQKAATRDGGIPLLITTDQEGGSVARLGSGTALPGNMALGANGSLEDAKKAGEIIGSELSVLGINTTLSPVVDVNNNPNNPVIGLRSYGDDPTQVGELASAVISGLNEYNVIGCAKHFPGHGDVATDSHYGLPVVNKDKATLMNNELKPYQVAIDKGIDMIMTAHILYPGLNDDTLYSELTEKQEKLPSTMNKAILTDLLKGEMGFEGVISTDAMNMAGVAAAWSQPQRTAIAMEAGADLICMPVVLYCKDQLKDLDAVIDYCVKEHDEGRLTDDRLNDACRRILTLKEKKGILDWNEADYSLEKALEVVGGKTNRETEREISARAVTVVRNENNTLPLKLNASSKVVFATPFSNEPALTAMAWNRGKLAGTVPEGASMDYFVYTSEMEPTDEQKAKIDAADTVVVVTEVSNASRILTWQRVGAEAIVDYAHSNGKKAIIMSADKPYDVQMYANADAVMAVYGNKGTGVDPTETLIGGATGDTLAYGPNIIAGVEVALGTFGAQGKLPVSVTKFVNEENNPHYSDEVLYPHGFGLTYKGWNERKPSGGGSSNPSTPSKPEAQALLRLYNPNTGEHLFTRSQNEYNTLSALGWKAEGETWKSPAISDMPVYRVYNPNAGDHHYTKDAHERDVLVSLGWKDEGISWYSAGEDGVPVYRSYNPNAKAGSHHYTPDQNEHGSLVGLGWNDEGVSWFGLAE